MGVMMRAFLFCLALVFGLSTQAAADQGYPYPDMQIHVSDKPFQTLVDDLKAAVPANQMGLVTQACGSCGAASQGFTIPGNYVAGVFRNDFARRLFATHVEAGIEAPIRFYITENGGGGSTLSYRLPSAIFGAYGVADLDLIGAELDEIFKKIAEDALR